MSTKIEIVDRGRGMQLSTSRVEEGLRKVRLERLESARRQKKQEQNSNHMQAASAVDVEGVGGEAGRRNGQNGRGSAIDETASAHLATRGGRKLAVEERVP